MAADIYEQNLEQKSSLTTSDYIRVVGSDNVSYKQQMGNVSKVAVEKAYLTPPTALTSGADVLTLAVGVYYATSSVASSLVNVPTITANCRVEVAERIPGRRKITVTDSVGGLWINQMTSDTAWSGWVKYPSQPNVSGLSNIIGIYQLGTAVEVMTVNSYTVPNNSRHFLLFTGPYSNRGHAVYAISCNGSGGVYAVKIGGTSDMPASATGTGNSVTITNTSTSATYCAVVDVVITGTPMSIVT